MPRRAFVVRQFQDQQTWTNELVAVLINLLVPDQVPSLVGGPPTTLIFTDMNWPNCPQPSFQAIKAYLQSVGEFPLDQGGNLVQEALPPGDNPFDPDSYVLVARRGGCERGAAVCCFRILGTVSLKVGDKMASAGVGPGVIRTVVSIQLIPASDEIFVTVDPSFEFGVAEGQRFIFRRPDQLPPPP